MGVQIIPKESHEQEVIVKYLRAKKIFFFAVPNGGSRHKLEAINLKKQGVIKGIPDLTIFLPSQILFLELKRGLKQLKSGKMSNSSSKPSKEQEAVIERINKYPYAVSVVGYGAKHSIELIEKYLKGQNDVNTK